MSEADFQSCVARAYCLTRSILEALGFRRRRRCRLIRREELCSVELLNLKTTSSRTKHLLNYMNTRNGCNKELINIDCNRPILTTKNGETTSNSTNVAVSFRSNTAMGKLLCVLPSCKATLNDTDT